MYNLFVRKKLEYVIKTWTFLSSHQNIPKINFDNVDTPVIFIILCIVFTNSSFNGWSQKKKEGCDVITFCLT